MKITVLDGRTLNPGDNPWTGLAELGELVVHDATFPGDVVQRADGAEILVINKIRLTSDLLSQLPALRLIAVTATGHDCVDGANARQRGVTVVNVPVYGTDSVAQFTFAMLLELCHHVAAHDAAVRQGEWQRRGDFSFCLTRQIELAGKTLGVIGFGRIGQRVAALAHAFGMQVIATKRNFTSPTRIDNVPFVPIEDLASTADVISLHCPLTEQTRGLINTAFLQRCQPSLLLVNASRGPLVVEADLAAALHANQIAGAAVDVTSTEPIGDRNPLLTAPRCLITPHMAWATLEARQRLMQTTVENVAAFLRGAPQHVVN